MVREKCIFLVKRKVIYPKYSKHWQYLLAATLDSSSSQISPTFDLIVLGMKCQNKVGDFFNFLKQKRQPGSCRLRNRIVAAVMPMQSKLWSFQQICAFFGKDQILWEDQNVWKNLQCFFWNYLAMSKESGWLFQLFFVAFSEYLNFNPNNCIYIKPIVVAYNFRFQIRVLSLNIMSVLQILSFLVKNNLLQKTNIGYQPSRCDR